MIYLNLINKEYFNTEYKIDSFMTENEKTKNDFLSTKITDTNSTNIHQRLRDVFSQTTNNIIKKEISMIKNIPVILINSFAQDIYNAYYKIDYSNKTINANKNYNIKDNKKSLNNKYKNLYINNTFFQYVLDNVKHKIELITENNKHITVLYVTNLINSELKELQRQISDYKIQYLADNNSNNASKTSNYEVNSKNTFKFKTNSSIIKDNENISTNNNSSVLGSLIRNNIYTKRNIGTKKRKFETLNMFHINPNTIFQNKEIISSINRKDESNSEEKSPKKMQTINSYKNNKKNNSNSKDKISTNKRNLKYKFKTSNSVDRVYQRNGRNKSKLFCKKENKKIERTFSQVFLKKDYIKPRTV
jgi:hypothetical protein